MRYHYARRGHIPSGEMDLSDVLDCYALVARSEGLSDGRIALVSNAVRQFDAFPERILDVSKVSPDDLPISSSKHLQQAFCRQVGPVGREGQGVESGVIAQELRNHVS